MTGPSTDRRGNPVRPSPGTPRSGRVSITWHDPAQVGVVHRGPWFHRPGADVPGYGRMWTPWVPARAVPDRVAHCPVCFPDGDPRQDVA